MSPRTLRAECAVVYVPLYIHNRPKEERGEISQRSSSCNFKNSQHMWWNFFSQLAHLLPLCIEQLAPLLQLVLVLPTVCHACVCTQAQAHALARKHYLDYLRTSLA